MEKQFLGNINFTIKNETVSESCPSNIALIKYWGKYENQIPANPSISYTLNNCKTNTRMEFFANEAFSVQTFLAGIEEKKFAEKIEKYFKNIEQYLPWILKGKYVIHTENTFPHSSGIASSASGFGAIAKCLMKLDEAFAGETTEEELLKKASFLARLGSGSACRSLYNGLVVWGNTKEVEGSSDLYAVAYPNEEIHSVFRSFNDWVLLIHEGEKSVSSTVGHGLMKTNPYAERRFQEAHENFTLLKNILKTGDLEGFIKLTEHEALTLHAMMMMSDPAFILMKTGTLEVINKIWDFRRITGLPLFFTLDAGANVHLLFPSDIEADKIKIFIEQELLPFTQKGGVVKDKMRF
ncbi:diphosphomevalonate decarboxylase [Elizabethkingia meningoseptica]|uniref:diphosphomevalonate/mevalonate 3,5-bisphosphate decarboxylase family protein n=1 Tax=Elizabethkingia meningoseptica TaxID=238 RepID=UPI000332D33F|nr:diphosphomevalonate decarboxylase [Elizabethkingia meningoseptica]AQX05101.1 diphosphomevalonate decarboxylase [Elizabethkingia meningoseptica]AQX47144.1 diphosphomevalonate decarboxylase [Elizabethkingia meningoseptica]EOR30554.1 diphosphomevalonate decarboxylase [Elizabethkingia meningoseptica ATCC 13253 = NBRC 12535]KUY17881.1 diphosphomevalonate decarboxylase [Elizabethkingia meningoseptica]OPB68430.1 diphosphomevalonate decarboxylase [Elizabethkingia meningoseptica]